MGILRYFQGKFRRYQRGNQKDRQYNYQKKNDKGTNDDKTLIRQSIGTCVYGYLFNNDI